MDLAIKNGDVFLKGAFQKTNVYVKDGRIAEITDQNLDAEETYDAKGAMVLPGLIDPHVHFALDLGAFVSVDDFSAGSKAAAYGGVTTFIDFLDPVDNADDLKRAFETRLKEAKTSHLDYAFHATIKNPKGDLETFVQTMKDLGIPTLKFFTTYSESNRRTYDKDIKELLRLSKKHNITLLAHIENDDMITIKDEYTHEDLPKSRPSNSETTEALKLAGFVEETNGTLYMVHLSSGETLRALKKHYPHLLNKRFIVESCPQYFAFNDASLRGEKGKLFTFAPPLRSEADRKALWDHFDDVHTIGTDHCAFMKADKQASSLKDMPLGIGGVEHSFSILYRHFKNSLIEKMSLNNARVHHLTPRKGDIAVGADADLAIFEAKDTIIKNNHAASDYSVYEGQPAGAVLKATIARGAFIVKDGAFYPQKGHFLKRSERNA